MCVGRASLSLVIVGISPQYAFLHDVSTKLLLRMREIDKINLIRHIALVQTGTDLAQEPDGEAFKREYRDIDVGCLSGFSICPRPE